MASIAIGVDEIAARLGHWSGGSGPLHRRLSDALRQAINTGSLRRGSRLPGDRTLARGLSVSRTTTSTAYATLKQEGWLAARGGSGTTVAMPTDGTVGAVALPASAPRAAMFRRLVDDGGDVIDLTLAALPALDGVAEALAEALRDSLPTALDGHGYELVGVAALRGAVARWFARHHAPTDPEQVVITNGTQQAIALVAATLLAPGDRVLVEETTHPGALSALRDLGAVLCTAPVGLASTEPSVLEAALAGDVRLAYLAPTHHNPTGAVLGAAGRRRVAAAAARAGVTLLEDLTLAGLALDGGTRPPPLATTPEGATVLSAGSVSKTAWGGLRAGWVRAPAALVPQLVARKAAMDLGSPVLEQHAAALLLDREEELLMGRRRVLTRQRDALEAALHAALPAWRFTSPSGGMALWVDVGEADGGALAQVALRHGVAVAPGYEFAAGSAGRHHIRISFAAPVPLLEQAVERLAAAWATLYAPGRHPLV